MDKKYYIIMEGEYSDKCPVAITDNLELAEAYCRIKNATTGQYENYWISDSDGMELLSPDTNMIEQAKKIKKVHSYTIRKLPGDDKWHVYLQSPIVLYMETDKTGVEITRFSCYHDPNCYKKVLIYEENKGKAAKIFWDYLAKLNAEEAGL